MLVAKFIILDSAEYLEYKGRGPCASGTITSFDKIIEIVCTYHETLTQCLSTIFSAVDQLKRTNWGNPKTSSTLSISHFLVLGSTK